MKRRLIPERRQKALERLSRIRAKQCDGAVAWYWWITRMELEAKLAEIRRRDE